MIDPVSTPARLRGFVESLLVSGNFDLVVCGERKATAIFRALIQEIDPPRLSWQWDRVLSTNAMASYPWDRFEGKRVLLFDELVHHGTTLRRAAEWLRTSVPKGVEIVTAGFAVWSSCLYRPDISYYAAVNTDRYAEIRQDLIRFLQRQGSLLLDTEHVEIGLHVSCTTRELFEHLASACEDDAAYSFLSGGDRLNLTLSEPRAGGPTEVDIKKWIPGGTDATASVRKIRVVEREHNLFAAMPICYPNVPAHPPEDWWRSLPSFFKEDGDDGQYSPDWGEVFGVVGLLSSVALLDSLVWALGPLLSTGKAILEMAPESFAHLRAVFPRLDTARFGEYVANRVALARRADSDRAVLRTRRKPVYEVSHDQVVGMASAVLKSLILRSDEAVEIDRRDAGLPWRLLLPTDGEIRDLDVAPSGAWATVPDWLIDNGFIVPQNRLVSVAGNEMAVRVFRPESEIVADRLRRQLAVRGDLRVA